jgi:hypothetical protein
MCTWCVVRPRPHAYRNLRRSALRARASSAYRVERMEKNTSQSAEANVMGSHRLAKSSLAGSLHRHFRMQAVRRSHENPRRTRTSNTILVRPPLGADGCRGHAGASLTGASVTGASVTGNRCCKQETGAIKRPRPHSFLRGGGAGSPGMFATSAFKGRISRRARSCLLPTQGFIRNNRAIDRQTKNSAAALHRDDSAPSSQIRSEIHADRL